MKKQLAAAACAAFLSLGLVACGGSAKSSGSAPSEKVEQTQEQEGSGEAAAVLDKLSEAKDKVAGAAQEAVATSVTPEFKEAMDSYEAFFDEYVAFMEKYKSSSDPTSLMSEYSSYMARYSEMMEKFNAVDQDSLSEADQAYYVEVSARISQKTASVAF